MNELNVIVEIPKGSRNKYEYDKEKGFFKLDRMLFSSTHYPTDYGYIENTLAPDGDALDAMVILWEPTFPGCLIEARYLGHLDMEDEKGRDEKVLCVPLHDPNWNHLTDLCDVPEHLLREIEHFFAIYKKLEEKEVEIRGWKPKEETAEVIKKAFADYSG